MVIDILGDVLGLDEDSLSAGQMALRAAIVYAVALAYVRLGDKRFLGKNTAFDVVIAIMFGSVMSRAITQATEFVPIMVGGGVLVALHYVVALVTFRSDRIGNLVKGNERRLISDGEIQWDQMAAAHVTERDLRGALRAQAQLEDVGEVRVAHLERSGDISAIKRQEGTRVVSVDVADGVQTVRIEIGS
jgi:uncharacterized membrane protein YcaP (DUF421 family)